MNQYAQRRPQQLEDIAERKLHEHGITSIPVNPLTVAKQEGVSVVNAEFHVPTIAGLIRKTKDTIVIYVKSSDAPSRKKFTVAHELGHLYLHLKDDSGNFIDNDVSLFRSIHEPALALSPQEIEANEFAMALIMPLSNVIRQWKMSHSVEDMAVLFDVSVQAMEIRLRDLGLLDG